MPTEYYRKQLIHHGFEPAKLRVMARGVDTQLFNPGKRDRGLLRRYGLAEAFKFLYVGRLSREKNLDGLVDAFEGLLRGGHQASLVMVGDGPYREQLQARCQGRPVVFTGLLEGEELAAAYASADAMVFPSTTDTFGNVVLEAQASGLPVIVTDRGGPAEIVRRYESGIVVDHTRPQALMDAMERLYLSPQFRAELRSARTSQRRREQLAARARGDVARARGPRRRGRDGAVPLAGSASCGRRDRHGPGIAPRPGNARAASRAGRRRCAACSKGSGFSAETVCARRGFRCAG